MLAEIEEVTGGSSLNLLCEGTALPGTAAYVAGRPHPAVFAQTSRLDVGLSASEPPNAAGLERRGVLIAGPPPVASLRLWGPGPRNPNYWSWDEGATMSVDLRPEWPASSYEEIEAIVCFELEEGPGTRWCNYTGGRGVQFRQIDVVLTAYEAHSGEPIAETRVAGASREDCPEAYTFVGDTTSVIRALPPEDAQILDGVSQIVAAE